MKLNSFGAPGPVPLPSNVWQTKFNLDKRNSVESVRFNSIHGLKPLAEVKGALLVVEVLQLPRPQLSGLGLGNSREHSAHKRIRQRQ